MKYMSLLVYFCSCSLFLQSSGAPQRRASSPFAFTVNSKGKEPETRILHIELPGLRSPATGPKACISSQLSIQPEGSTDSDQQNVYLLRGRSITQEQYFANWCKVVGREQTDVAAKATFDGQFAHGRIPLSVTTRLVEGREVLDPYTQFLCLSMHAAFDHDQKDQLETRNSGRRISKPAPKPDMTLLEFIEFQKRVPKSFMLTPNGREAIALFAMQHSQPGILLRVFSQKTNLAPSFEAKTVLLVEKLKPDFERIKQARAAARALK